MTVTHYNAATFADLVVRDMKGEASDVEAAFLRSPTTLYRWRHALKAKHHEGQRHIDNRNTLLEHKRADLGIDTDADIEELTDDEYDEYFSFKEDIDAKNRSSAHFMSYVEDALEEVGALIREIPVAYDPAEVIEFVFNARDAIGSSGNSPSPEAVDRARSFLDRAVAMLTEGAD